MHEIFYRNRLPHIAPIGATFFVTFRLDDALPRHIVKALKANFDAEIEQIKKANPKDLKLCILDARKKYFGKYEHQLDRQPYGACHLKKTEVAQIVLDKMKEYDGSLYDLQAACIMPNHVHAMFSLDQQLKDPNQNWTDETPEDYVQLDAVMQLIKGGSSFLINRHLGRSGKLWCKDSYDHYVRDEREWHNILGYILNNPVKAGLVKEWNEWSNLYLKPSLVRLLSGS
jgi:REP element-mobilizing transposase RayT